MSVAATYASGVDVRPAGFWIRVMATFVDSFILTAVQLVMGFAVGMGLGMNGADEVTQKGMIALVQVIAWVFAFAYLVGFVALKGATPGKMAFGLRVVRDDGRETVGFWKAFLREVPAKLLSGIVLGLGYLMVAAREDKRGLHDRLVRTSVVKG